MSFFFNFILLSLFLSIISSLSSIATFFTGPLQSSSRVVMANLTDDNRQGFSFGIFTLSGKITAFLGPILASALTFLISQRVGFGFSIVLLSLGLFLMIGVSYNNVKSKT